MNFSAAQNQDLSTTRCISEYYALSVLGPCSFDDPRRWKKELDDHVRGSRSASGVRERLPAAGRRSTACVPTAGRERNIRRVGGQTLVLLEGREGAHASCHAPALQRRQDAGGVPTLLLANKARQPAPAPAPTAGASTPCAHPAAWQLHGNCVAIAWQ